jgi:hypothetical protein
MLNPRLLSVLALALTAAACADLQGPSSASAESVCYVNAVSTTRTPATPPVLVRISQNGNVLNPEALPRAGTYRLTPIPLDSNWRQSGAVIRVVEGVGPSVCQESRGGPSLGGSSLGTSDINRALGTIGRAQRLF